MPSSNSFGENLFLFVWAVFSNTKEFLVEYVHDVTELVVPSMAYTRKQINNNRKHTSKSKQKKAYFRRVRHQMGVFTPEKEKQQRKAAAAEAAKKVLMVSDEEDQLNLEATVDNLLNFSGESESATRLEDLEHQLLVLKKEMAFLTNNNHVNSLTAPVSIQKRKSVASKTLSPPKTNIGPSVPPPPVMFTSAPPPPPPPVVISSMPIPPPLPLHVKEISSPSIKSQQQSGTISKPRVERSMSLAEMIKNSKKENLKSTTLKRSPGGTPLKHRSNSAGNSSGGFQNELFAAIRNKFKSQEESDTESDDDFASPGCDKENLSPQVAAANNMTKTASYSPPTRVLRKLNL
jgi:hypothetical protein